MLLCPAAQRDGAFPKIVAGDRIVIALQVGRELGDGGRIEVALFEDGFERSNL